MDVAAKDYEADNNIQVELGIKLAEKYLKDVKPTDNVLDLGSGTGEITHNIHQMTGCRIIGLDILEDMTRHSNDKYGGENVSFLTADIQAENWVENYGYRRKFKWVVSFNAIHWIDNIDSVINNIHKVLQPGGHVVLYYVLRNYSNDPYSQVEQVLTRKKWSVLLNQASYKTPSFQRNFGDLPAEQWRHDVNGLIRKFQTKNFKIVDKYELHQKYPITESFLKLMLPVFQYLTPKQQDDLLAELMGHTSRHHEFAGFCLVCVKPE